MNSPFDIPHGVANALLLPVVMEYNMPSSIEKYGKIAEAMGVNTSNMGEAEAAESAVDAVRKLAISIGIPQHLSELGIKAEDIDILSSQAIEDVCTPGNPRGVTKKDILELYKKGL